MSRNKTIWILVRSALIIISVLIFTPLVTPAGVFTPFLFGIPYTLWMGILIYICFVSLIFIGIKIHARLFPEPKND